MKKSKNCPKNYKSSDKRYIKKIRLYYPSFLYKRLDRWLKNMSLKGWHIVDCRIFCFVFEKGEPKEKEYFTYGLPTIEGKYSVSMRHPFLEKLYGVSKKKSRINRNEKKSYCIVEIDTQKIDVQNDVGYKELINDRDKLYLLFFLTRTLPIIICIVLALMFFIKSI